MEIIGKNHSGSENGAGETTSSGFIAAGFEPAGDVAIR
jgi:hypothetical protein